MIENDFQLDVSRKLLDNVNNNIFIFKEEMGSHGYSKDEIELCLESHYAFRSGIEDEIKEYEEKTHLST